MNNDPLIPSAVFHELFPPDTVFSPRTSWENLEVIVSEPFRVDTLTGNTFIVMGEMPILCHCCVATPPALRFFAECGLSLPTQIETYETEQESISLALEAAGRGNRIAFLYPPPGELRESPDLLIPVPLYNWLNDKANLEALVAPVYLPRYELFAPDELSGIGGFMPESGVFIKGCRAGASGGGKDVRFCADHRLRSSMATDLIASRPGGLTAIRVEEAVPLRNCWCLSLAISGSRLRYLGGAMQLFGEPGQQCGSRVDSSDPPPPAVVDLALTIAGRARELGFLGVAGFDIGVTGEGRPYIFDLNFRVAASTVLVLLHESATQRIGGSVSQSWGIMVPGPLRDILDRLAPFARRGCFVPFRLCEATAASGGLCVVNGMLVSDSVAGIERVEAELSAVF